jgi:hypothetical protein
LAGTAVLFHWVSYYLVKFDPNVGDRTTDLSLGWTVELCELIAESQLVPDMLSSKATKVMPVFP